MDDLLILPANEGSVEEGARRVLVIEDDPLQRMIQVVALEATGWVVSEADVATAGVAAARLQRPDVILLDLELPGWDGLWVLEALRDDVVTADIPVILLTGDMKVPLDGLTAGAHDYVSKPFHPRELSARADAAWLLGREHRRVAEAEHMLHKQYDFQQAVLGTVASLVIVFDRSGRILAFNPACERASGRLAAEVIGQTFWSQLLPPERWASVAANLAGSNAAKFPGSGEITWLHRDGSLRTITWSASVLFDDDGEALHFVCTGLDVTEARAVERRIAETELRYRMLVDLAAEGVWAIDADAVTTFANDSLGALLGYPTEGLIGRSMYDFMDDEGKALAATSVDRRRKEFSENHDFKFIRGDGSELWVSMNTAPIINPDGGYAGAVALLSDVSARRTLEIDLRRREAEFRLVAENSTDMISRHSPDGTYLYLSPACQELLGYTPEELVGTSTFELIHPDDLAEIAATLQAILSSVDVTTVEYRLRRSDGTYVWLEATTRVIRDEAGLVVELDSASRDITVRRQTEEALRNAEERFRSAFENAPIGIALTGPDRRAMQVNSALHQMLGYQPGTLVGSLPSALIHPDDIDVGQDQVRAMLAGRQDTASYEQRFLHASGRDVWVSVNLTLVLDADQRAVNLLSHIQDITERRRYDTELREEADRDPLTSLLNRRSFERELNRHTAEVARYGPSGALLVLDLDHFKAVNDTLGHPAGDALLVSVAHLLQSAVRETDHVARLGGDEFAILLPRGDVDAAIVVAENLRTAIGEGTSALQGAARLVTASVGIAIFDSARQTDDMLIAADLALYEAKGTGRDRWATATPDAQPDALGAPPG